MANFLVIAVLIQITHASWSTGHVGIDRPGGTLLSDPLNVQDAGACFHACRSVLACRAWVFKDCEAKPTCLLKNSVPQQRAVDFAADCRVTSGVRHAADQGLVPLKYKPLRLGEVKVGGWLRDQLIVMANGLSGHLNLFWKDVQNSVWIGGTEDHSGAGHERGPYWLNGMVPLTAHLNASGDIGSLDVDINAQVNSWVTYILDHQLPDGWLGPDDGFGGKGNTYWTGWNTAASLIQYADAVGIGSVMGKRCTKAVLDYIKCVHTRMLTTPTTAWTQNRWQDWAYIIHWLMDLAPQGQEQLLWDAAELTYQQSWDWDAYYAQVGVGSSGAYVGKAIPKFPESNVGGWTMWDHGVNNAMGTKSCHTWYRQSHNDSDLLNAKHKLYMQDRFHGQPYGVFSADECFGGRDLNRGIELCAVVEQMYSLQYMFKVEGDPTLLDRMERIAYNALPGTITADSWQHQYLQQANEINASYNTNPHVWQTDGSASTGFGVEPNFGCCTANMQQGWPKLASNIFLEDSDGNLVVALLLPAKVTFKGTTVDMTTSDFPFADDVNIDVSGSTSPFILRVRIPSWAHGAVVSVNSGAKTPAKNGSIVSIECMGATKLTFFLNPKIRVEKGWGSLGKSSTPVLYNPYGARVPVKSAADFTFESGEIDETSGVQEGGAGTTNSRKPGVTDIRSGNPGEVTRAIVAHPIESLGHYITSFGFSYQYIAGYGAAGAPGGTNFTLELIDAVVGITLHTIYASPPLENYSYDHYTGYSPASTISLTDLKIDCEHAVAAVLRFQNNRRNIQIPLDTMKLTIGWSIDSAPGPHDPPANYSVPPTNAAAILRGALLYALPLQEETNVVKIWTPFNNTDVNMVTNTPWNLAMHLDNLNFVSLKPEEHALPWAPTGVRTSITANACSVSTWRETCNAAAEPMTSPLNESSCGPAQSVKLVPYGSTNLRMSAFPWLASSEVAII